MVTGPCEVSHACQSEESLPSRRRFWMKDAAVGWNLGKPLIRIPSARSVPSTPLERGVLRDARQEARADVREFRPSRGHDRRHANLGGLSGNACPASRAEHCKDRILTASFPLSLLLVHLNHVMSLVVAAVASPGA